MAIIILGLLFAVVVVAIAYPLLSRQPADASHGAPAAPAITDNDVERAVRRLRDTRLHGLHCPTCGSAYRVGDRFCVKCGADLPAATSDVQPPPVPTACPECGTPVRPGDVFCSKCGHKVAAGEEI